MNDFDVILGNSALLKCDIPSFVNDFINVIAWIENEKQEMYKDDNYVRGKISIFFFFLFHWDTQNASIISYTKVPCYS